MVNVQVMLLAARLFGFSSYNYRETNDGYVATLSPAGITCCLTNVVLFLYFAYKNVEIPESYTSTGSSVVDTGGKMILQIGYADIIFILIRWWIQKSWTLDMLNAFHAIEKQFLAHGITQDVTKRNRHYMLQALLEVFMALSAVVYSQFVVIILGDSFRNLPIFYGHLLISITAVALCGLFTANIIILLYKVQALNSYISQHLCDDERTHLRPLFGRKRVKVDSPQAAALRKALVANVAQLYDEIHTITQDLSNRYMIEFSGFCLVNVLYGMMAMYTFYRAIFKADYTTRLGTSIFLTWALVYKVCLFEIVYNCHQLWLEGMKTAELIGYAAAQENDLQCNKKMHSFLCQIQHNPIKITTNFFDVNVRVFFVIIGTVATYLFILIQFAG